MVGIFTIFFCYFVSSIGFSIIYSKNNPLILAPGETKDIQVYAGNSPTEGDMKLKVDLTEGGEIASLTDSDTTYDVKAGGLVPVNIRIRIPSNVAEGTEYTVGLVVRGITPAGGTVSIAGETGASFTVLVQKPVTPVIETPQEERIGAGWIILGIIVIIAVIIIIYFIIKSRKR